MRTDYKEILNIQVILLCLMFTWVMVVSDYLTMPLFMPLITEHSDQVGISEHSDMVGITEHCDQVYRTL